MRDHPALNWSQVNRALIEGSRGLPGGTTLADLLQERRGVRNKQNLPRIDVEQIERDLIPAARLVRDSAFRQFTGGEVSVLAYLEAQRSYNETIRQYRDMVTRHRRSMLDLNTALGRRVVP